MDEDAEEDDPGGGIPLSEPKKQFFTSLSSSVNGSGDGSDYFDSSCAESSFSEHENDDIPLGDAAH